MKKTCLNCTYCQKAQNSYYCKALNVYFDSPKFTAFNQFLVNHRYDIPAASNVAVYNDILTGEVYCYRFSFGEANNDKILKQNFEANKKLALETIDHILKTEIIYDTNTFMFIKLSKIAKQQLLDLRDQFLKINFIEE